jgi:hypothetical protein
MAKAEAERVRIDGLAKAEAEKARAHIQAAFSQSYQGLQPARIFRMLRRFFL